MAEAKRKLKNITFKTSQKHIAITDESEPACSGYGAEAVLFKSESVEKGFTENQKKILDELNVEYDKEEVLTTKSTEDALVASDVENNKNQTETDSEMSEEIIKSLRDELATVKLEQAKLKIEKKINKFEFEAEVAESLSNVLASVDEASVEVIVKSLDAVAVVAVEKSEKLSEGNALAKSLVTETGLEQESEKEDEAEDIVSKAIAYADKIQKGELR